VRELPSPAGRGGGQPNLAVIENLIEQIRGTNLESGAKDILRERERNHSDRRAIIGSTFVARRAGTSAASRATVTSMSVTMPNVLEAPEFLW